MKETSKSTERFQELLRHASRKRKRSCSPDNEALPPAKRPCLIDITPPSPRSFLRKVREWQDRKRKIEIGIPLYLETQKLKMADAFPSTPAPSMSLSEEALAGIRAAEELIEEITKEIDASAPKRRGIIKRLDINKASDDTLEDKVVPVKRRGGWRKKGEKRL